ncbi:LuxR C-terminal-related transcriptional regulator [Zobellella sp. DQSA1]|uniref:helix-turn-helix transcriptional regulator n=1 Tax=Zobellella sp. DQSA1 TaxID=3342386 RepID=UPI0035C10BAD
MLAKSDLLLTLDLISKCLEIRSQENLKELKDTLSKELGISSMVAGRVCRYTKVETGYFFGISEEWSRLYIENNYSMVDPVFNLSIRSSVPFLWATAYSRAGHNSNEFIQRARDFSLMEGICYAPKDYSMVADTTVVSLGNGKTPLDRMQVEIIKHLIPHIAETLMRPSLWNNPRLTPKEIEVIKWCAHGKSYWEISLVMSISERTVKFHMNNIFKKLDVLNKAQAVARCMSLGYV